MADEHTPNAVELSTVGIFAQGWSTDNALVALAVRNGEAPEQAEIIELIAGAQCVFSLVTIFCRQQTRIEDCAALWTEALELYAQALEHWVDVPLSSHTGCLVRALERLRERCADRLEVYRPLGADRRALVARRALDA